MKCPCHSKKDYEVCCGPFHKEEKLPETPVELMRSRYSAYALNIASYIIKTTHPKSPLYEQDLTAWTNSIHHFSKTTAFQDLIIESAQGSEVTFFARLNTLGKDTSFREHSLFEKLSSRWYYLRPLNSS